MRDGSYTLIEPDSSDAAEAERLDMINRGATFTNRLPDMGAVLERLFRAYRTNVYQDLRWSVSLSDETTDLVAHDDFLTSASANSVLYGVIDLPPIRGLTLAIIDGSLLAAFVDSLFGAPSGLKGTGYECQSSDLSNMETRIGNRLMNITAKTLEDTFKSQIAVTASLVRTETHSALASVGDAADPYCILSALISLPTGDGRVSIAIPYRGLEPYREALSAPIGGNMQHEADKLWREQIRRALGSAPLTLGVEIGTSKVPVHALKTLGVGDVLPVKLHDGAHLTYAGTSIATGRYGAHEEKYGVMIDDE